MQMQKEMEMEVEDKVKRRTRMHRQVNATLLQWWAIPINKMIIVRECYGKRPYYLQQGYNKSTITVSSKGGQMPEVD